jgi:hypothetical protein
MRLEQARSTDINTRLRLSVTLAQSTPLETKQGHVWRTAPGRDQTLSAKVHLLIKMLIYFFSLPFPLKVFTISISVAIGNRKDSEKLMRVFVVYNFRFQFILY